MSSDFDLMFWLAGGVLGALGLWLLYWSVLHDRSRGRRRCPKCWYDMSGVPGSRTCSECGHAAKREKQFFKTRRRKRWTVVALGVFLMGASCALLPKVRREGVVSIVPTPALILLAPHMFEVSWRSGPFAPNPITAADRLAAELSRRIKDKSIAAWEVSWADEIAAKMLQDPTITPGQDAWAESLVMEILWAGGDSKPACKRLAAMLGGPDSPRQDRADRLLYNFAQWSKSDLSSPLLQELMPLLSNPNVHVRCRACMLIAVLSHRGEPALPALRELQQDRNEQVQVCAVWAIANVGGEALECLPIATMLLREGRLKQTRSIAAETLRLLGRKSQPALPDLIEALSDEDAAVRWSAIVSIGQCGPAGAPAVPALIKGLQEANGVLARAPFIKALGQIGPAARDAGPVLRDIQRRSAAEREWEVIDTALRSIGAE